VTSGSLDGIPSRGVSVRAPALPGDFVPGPVAVEVQLAPVDGQERSLIRRKQDPINPLEQHPELTLVRRLDDDHPARFVRWKAPVVEVVAVHRHQRTPQLMGQLEMGGIRGTAELLIFEDEQDIPSQMVPHVGDEAGWNVGVGVDPRPGCQALGVRCELGGKSAHLNVERKNEEQNGERGTKSPKLA
jgi:hypothetical protein